MLELPDRSGVFGVGDVIHFEDPKTRVQVPATAQAALAEAPIAGTNVVAQWLGRPLKRFEYRERSVLVSVGLGQAAGNVRSLTIWGRPAALLKSLVQREYAVAREVGTRPPGL
jgi:NADH dehydrogenase